MKSFQINTTILILQTLLQLLSSVTRSVVCTPRPVSKHKEEPENKEVTRYTSSFVVQGEGDTTDLYSGASSSSHQRPVSNSLQTSTQSSMTLNKVLQEGGKLSQKEGVICKRE